jgi:hypothetical protein
MDKEMKWIDIHDQLPPDGEEVWICILPLNPYGGIDGNYSQCTGKFNRDYGWRLPYGGKVHYWFPKPSSPPLPKWYKEALLDG